MDDTRPNLEDLERMAAGLSLEPEVQAAIERRPDLMADVERIRDDNALLGEFAAAVQPSEPAPAAAPQEPVPGYRVTGELGRGGQAVVLRAIQTATRRPVALKLLSRGVFSSDRERRRLDREIELLAALRHPGVVTVYDGGVTDEGRAWLAMELIEGVPLDVAADRIRAECASQPRERDRRLARLVADVAAAVEAAHRRGVMHRDLKPSNILVDAEGRPRVLDFGLAREVSAQAHSEEGAFLGTLAYASPEQLAGHADAVDARTDVFALGVVLYESLVGTRPWPAATSLAGAVKRVDQPVEAPSRRVRAVSPDLETIILHSLASDPERRYPSAGHLREDLERFLEQRPIAAHRDSPWYRTRMFVRRHRVPVAAAAVVAMLIVAFGVVTGVQALRLSVSNTKLTAQTTVYQQLTDSFLESIQSLQADDAGRVTDIADFLDGLARIVDEEMPNDPAVIIGVRRRLAEAEIDVRRYDKARAHMDVAIPLAVDENASASVLGTLHHLRGQALWNESNFTEAEADYRVALDQFELEPGEGGRDLARTIAHIASCYRTVGRADEALPLYRRALAIRREALDPTHVEIQQNRNSLAVCLIGLDRPGEAAEELLDLRDQLESQYGRDSAPATAVSHNLGRAYTALEQYDDALAALQYALDGKRAIASDGDDESSARTLAEIGRVHRLRGDLDRAHATLIAATAVLRAQLGEDHAVLALPLYRLGITLMDLGQPAEALPSLREAATIASDRLGGHHWLTHAARSELAAALAATGDPRTATQVLGDAPAVLEGMQGVEDDARERAAAIADRLASRAPTTPPGAAHARHPGETGR